jgi:hypothetical protein
MTNIIHVHWSTYNVDYYTINIQNINHMEILSRFEALASNVITHCHCHSTSSFHMKQMG